MKKVKQPNGARRPGRPSVREARRAANPLYQQAQERIAAGAHPESIEALPIDMVAHEAAMVEIMGVYTFPYTRWTSPAGERVIQVGEYMLAKAPPLLEGQTEIDDVHIQQMVDTQCAHVLSLFRAFPTSIMDTLEWDGTNERWVEDRSPTANVASHIVAVRQLKPGAVDPNDLANQPRLVVPTRH